MFEMSRTLNDIMKQAERLGGITIARPDTSEMQTLSNIDKLAALA